MISNTITVSRGFCSSLPCLVKILIDQSYPPLMNRVVSLVLWHAKIILLHTTHCSLYNSMRIMLSFGCQSTLPRTAFPSTDSSMRDLSDSITNPVACESTSFVRRISSQALIPNQWSMLLWPEQSLRLIMQTCCLGASTRIGRIVRNLSGHDTVSYWYDWFHESRHSSRVFCWGQILLFELSHMFVCRSWAYLVVLVVKLPAHIVGHSFPNSSSAFLHTIYTSISDLGPQSISLSSQLFYCLVHWICKSPERS